VVQHEPLGRFISVDLPVGEFDDELVHVDAETLTDDEGRFTLELLQGVSYSVRASSLAGSAASRLVMTGDRTIALRLIPH
jgi:hypothetical protein